MDRPSKTLPDGYVRSGAVNLKSNVWLAVLLNIGALVVFVLSLLLLLSFATRVHPSLANTSGTITAFGMAGLLGLVMILLVTHELIHGLFFWVFTRSRPAFALRLFYAYAGAPAWYIPVRQYAVVASSPFAIIDAIGLLLVLLGPADWAIPAVLLIAFNTGGSLGDLLLVGHSFTSSRLCLALDSGDEVTFYEPGPKMVPA